MKKTWVALSDKTKDKIVVAIGIAVAVGCVLLLVPSVQTIGIKIGEKIAGRTLRDYNKWHRVIFSYGITILLFDIFEVVVYFNPQNFFSHILPKHYAKILTVLCVATTVLFIWFAMISSDIWTDEAYSLSAARHSFIELLKMGEKADIGHPPAYHAALSIWNGIFGDNIRNARIFSALPMVLLVWLGALFLKKEFSEKSAVAFVLLLLSSWYVFYHSFEIRMYSWAMFWVAISSMIAWYAMKTKKIRYLFCFVISAVCGAYTHYYAAFALIIYFIALAVWFVFSDKDKKMSKKNFLYVSLAAAVGVVLYSPWIACVLRAMSRYAGGSHSWMYQYYIDAGGIIGIVKQCFGMIFSSNGVSKYLFFIGCIVFAVGTTLSNEKKDYKYVWQMFNFFIPFALILTGVIVSISVKPLLIDRYVYPVAALPILFFCATLSQFLCKVKIPKIINKSNCTIEKIFILLFILLILYAHKNTQASFHYISFRQKQAVEFQKAFTGVERLTENNFAFVSASGAWILGYLYPDKIAYTKNGTGKKAYPTGQVYKNISDLPETGNFCVLIDAIGEEKDEAVFERVSFSGGRWNFYKDIYLAHTKDEVLALLEKDAKYLEEKVTSKN